MSAELPPNPETAPPPPRSSRDLATVGDVVRVSQKEITTISVRTLLTVGGALCAALVTVLGAGWAFLGQARAESRESGKAAAEAVIAPLAPRVTFLEQQVPFIVQDSRATREELRAFAQKGPSAVELFRPMAPLPTAAPDAGAPPGGP